MRKTTTTDNKASKIVCCRTCAHSHLIQYDQNPVLADCLKRPNRGADVDKFPYERDVASTKKYCSLHVEAKGEKEIEKRQKVA